MNIRRLVVQHEFYIFDISQLKNYPLHSIYIIRLRSDHILRVFTLLSSSRSGDTIRSRSEMILDDQCSFGLLLHCSILLNIAQHCSIMLDTDRLQELTDESKIICSHYRYESGQVRSRSSKIFFRKIVVRAREAKPKLEWYS